MTTPKTGAERKEALRGEQSATRPMTSTEVTIDTLVAGARKRNPALSFAEATAAVFKENPALYEAHRRESYARSR